MLPAKAVPSCFQDKLEHEAWFGGGFNLIGKKRRWPYFPLTAPGVSGVRLEPVFTYSVSCMLGNLSDSQAPVLL